MRKDFFPVLARCGSCATCVQLSRFGGTKLRADGPCETALSRLEGESTAVTLQLTSDPCALEVTWEDLGMQP